jgi:hypothetical protein
LTAELRFTRQVRLAEVGEEGQSRLASAVVRVAGEGLASAVEARYLRGAGVRVERGGAEPAAEPPPTWLSSLAPSARAVAAGAYAALTVVRAVVAGEPHPRVTAPAVGDG